MYEEEEKKKKEEKEEELLSYFPHRNPAINVQNKQISTAIHVTCTTNHLYHFVQLNMLIESTPNRGNKNTNSYRTNTINCAYLI